MSGLQTKKVAWTRDFLEIGNICVCESSSSVLFDRLSSAIDAANQISLGFCNANMLLIGLKSPDYAENLKKLILLNDGIGIDLCSILFRGRRFRENLNGTDMIPAFLEHETQGRTLFLLGARSGVAEQAASRLATRYPQHQIVGTRDGYFTPEEVDVVLAQINSASPDILLVALGNPHQERFIAEHAPSLDVRLIMGVGAYLDYTAGTATRAPIAFRRLRLEWFYRLLREPRRLWRRYTLDIVLFLITIVSLRVVALVRHRVAGNDVQMHLSGSIGRAGALQVQMHSRRPRKNRANGSSDGKSRAPTTN